jgi:hypothetical protein
MGAPDGLSDGAGFAIQDLPARPEQNVRCPNIAPAYYLGRPARVWITAFRPRRGRTASDHVMEAVTVAGNERSAGAVALSPVPGRNCLPDPTATSLPVLQTG